MGLLPKPGEWVRLEVPASKVGFGLNTNDIDGMSFVLDGGRATWDFSGRVTFNFAKPMATGPGDTQWINGSLPAGAIAKVSNNDQWQWIPCSGAAIACHQSVSGQGFKEHYFQGAAPQLVNPGDKLFTYVFLDPNQRPDQIFIEWHDGTQWHRAFWGANYFEVGTTGTENWRYMGGLPEANEWARLEIPASYVGLDGKSVSGMGFGFFKQTGNAQVLWGKSGKSLNLSSVPLTLSAMTTVYRFKHPQFGYYYSTKEIPLHSADQLEAPKFYIHPTQAAGTVPLYQFGNTNTAKREFFYSQCRTCPGPEWTFQKVAFYVYPDNSTPGTVPLYLFRDSAQHYFLTTIQSEGNGMSLQGIWGYVHVDNPLAPATPAALTGSFCRLSWLDSSGNETKFRIETREVTFGAPWNFVTEIGPNNNSIDDCSLIHISRMASGNVIPDYRVFAVNDIGDSFPSNALVQPRGCIKGCGSIRIGSAGDSEGAPVLSEVPLIAISSPAEGAVVGKDLLLAADAFDWDGNGTITKIEFYDNGVKLGELTTPPPYNFIWKNAPAGIHTLTAVAKDGSGMTATSAAIHVTVTSPPLVNLISPADGTIVTAPANVAVQATASDSDGSINKVEFLQGDVKIGEDSTAPYSFTWNAVPSGVYALTARAIDNVGMAVTSAPIALTVNSLPTVEMAIHPASGSVAPGGEVLLTSNSLDSDGTISQVEFYRGTTLIGTVTSFPFVYSWTNVPSGNHSLTAKATDNSGGTATSAPVMLVANTAPTVSISQPTDQTVFPEDSNLTINAAASDSDGSISKVEFYEGSTLLGADTSSPFAITWANVAAGTYSLTVKATDNLGSVAISSAITVVSNALPTASITSPTNNTTLNAPASFTVNASASDPDGSIAKVDFYQGNTLLLSDTKAPFGFVWPAGTGTYSLTARATDNRGAVTISAPITVISNAVPTVSITSPLNPAMFAPGSNLEITANANDTDGAVSKVEFYQGSTLLATDTTAPFSFAWNNLAFGSYSLTAKATDNRGAIATSPAVRVSTPTFFDDFNDNSLNSSKWTVQAPTSSAVLSEQNQQLRITLPPSTATYNGVMSTATYDMRGGTVEVQQIQSVSQAGWAENMLKVELNAQNYLLINAGSGSLSLRSMVNGVNDQTTIPFTASAQRFWRIRHNQSANTVTFETSADGSTWTVCKTVTAGFSLTTVRFYLLAGASGTGNSSPGTAVYEDFSFTAASPVLLSDDFNDNILDSSKWTINELMGGLTDTGVPIGEIGQRLEIGPLLQNTDGSHYRGIRSVNSYDFNGVACSVELVQPAAGSSSAGAMLTVGTNADNYYRIYVSEGNLIGQRRVNATQATLFTVPYDAVNHRFLRVRHNAGSVIMETAPGSGSPGTWVPQFSQMWSPSIQLTAIRFEVTGGTWQVGVNAPGKVVFDNFLATK